MHASLTKDGVVLLMAADMMDPETFTRGDTIILSINCRSEEEVNTIFSKLSASGKEINDIFSKLSAGGKVRMPLSEQFWGVFRVASKG